MQFCDEALWAKSEFDLAESEQRLTEWFETNVVIGYRIDDDAAELEASLIGRYPSPFNTVGNRQSQIVLELGKKRKLFKDHLEKSVELPKPSTMMPSQWLLSAKSHKEGVLSKLMTESFASSLRSVL